MQKNHHNQIRLSQRNPCKIKVFLGCPYYTAISLQYIKELREFIQTCPADEITDSRFFRAVRQDLIADNPRVEIHFEHFAVAHFILLHELRFSLFRIHIHAAEFVHFKFLSVFTDALLGKKDRSRRTDINHRCHKHKDNCGQQATCQTSCDIHQSFSQKLLCARIIHRCSQYCIIPDFLYKLLFAKHIFCFREIEMNRYSCLRKFFHQFFRIWRIL